MVGQEDGGYSGTVGQRELKQAMKSTIRNKQ